MQLLDKDVGDLCSLDCYHRHRGHAKVVYEIFVASDGAMHVKGFISAEFDEGKRQFMGKPVLGTDSMLPELRDKGIRQFIVAIGDSRIRERLHADAARWGFVPVTAVHPWAAISPSAQLGRDVAIMAGAVVNANTRAADGAIVNRGATVDHDCLLESFSHVCPGAHLAGNVSVGERAVVGIGASVVEVEGARITRLVGPPLRPVYQRWDLHSGRGCKTLGDAKRVYGCYRSRRCPAAGKHDGVRLSYTRIPGRYRSDERVQGKQHRVHGTFSTVTARFGPVHAFLTSSTQWHRGQRQTGGIDS